MSRASYSRRQRQQQRRINDLIDAIDRVSEDDRQFFASNPERTFRMRLQTKAEQREQRAIGGELECPLGCEIYTIVRQIAPGARIRTAIIINELNHVERFSDAACRLIYQEATAAYDEITTLEETLSTLAVRS